MIIELISSFTEVLEEKSSVEVTFEAFCKQRRELSLLALKSMDQ
jgi:hypothetical protein